MLTWWFLLLYHYCILFSMCVNLQLVLLTLDLVSLTNWTRVAHSWMISLALNAQHQLIWIYRWESYFFSLSLSYLYTHYFTLYNIPSLTLSTLFNRFGLSESKQWLIPPVIESTMSSYNNINIKDVWRFMLYFYSTCIIILNHHYYHFYRSKSFFSAFTIIYLVIWWCW